MLLHFKQEHNLNNPPALYIFLDEGGNFNFSQNGSTYFTLTCASMVRPFRLHTELDTYKYDLIEYLGHPRIELEYFHCSDDNRYVRNRVFEMLAEHLTPKSVDVLIVEKRKTGPAIQVAEKFYPMMLGYLLSYCLDKCPTSIGEVVVITDTLPVERKRRAMEKAVKQFLSGRLPKGTPYRLMHHSSKAHYGLQIADYLNWAVFRKWEKGDTEQYDKIEHLIRSEFDIFRTGSRNYY